MDLRSHLDDFTARDWQTVTGGGPVRLAMVAVGWWTREQAVPAVEESDLCETTVLVSGSREKAESATDLADSIERGITYDEFHDGVAADAYDAVYVVTPNALHLPYVETAAHLGKAVLCEKPMEASADRAAEMVACCAEADVPLMVAYRMQTEPAVRRARELVRDGVVGDPVHVHGHMSQPLLELIPDTDQWRLDPALSGGATVIDIGLYPLNTARFLLDADPVAVQATTRSESDAFADVADEHATFQVEFPGTVTAACTASQGSGLSSHVQVVGTEGEVRVDPAFFPWQPRELRLTRGDVTVEHTFDQANQMTEEFDYFADRLLSGEPIYPDGRHGLTDVRTVEAVYEAADRGERVVVEG